MSAAAPSCLSSASIAVESIVLSISTMRGISISGLSCGFFERSSAAFAIFSP